MIPDGCFLCLSSIFLVEESFGGGAKAREGTVGNISGQTARRQLDHSNVFAPAEAGSRGSNLARGAKSNIL